jgi:exodeoxyribonuclease VII large subunit
MQPNIPIKLSQLTGSIAIAIEDAFKEMRFWVIADVTSHSFRQEKGYHNFELVEKDSNSANVVAKIAGKSWGNGAKQIAAFEEATGQRFTNNIQVLVLLAVEYHPIFGISASVLDIDHGFTLGALEQQRNDTLRRLVDQNDFIRHVDGEYLTLNKGLKMAPVVQTIALLSSSISAGAEDFKHTLENNSFGYRFKVDDYFSTVQGERNAGQLFEKLVGIYKSGIAYDAVVITRGGGAQTDFLLFDSYKVARAVAKFPIPIITGIGHQKNQSITDLMAHTQTKTPTKAAELIIAHNRKFEEQVLSFQKDILIASKQLLSGHTAALSDTKQVILHGARDIVMNEKKNLAVLDQGVINHSRQLLFTQRARLLQLTAATSAHTRIVLHNRKNDINAIANNLKRISGAFLKNQKLKIENYSTTVRLMSPSNILKKGYAIIKVDGQVVSNADTIEKGMAIDILFADTTIHSTVKEKTKHDGTDTNL